MAPAYSTDFDLPGAASADQCARAANMNSEHTAEMENRQACQRGSAVSHLYGLTQSAPAATLAGAGSSQMTARSDLIVLARSSAANRER